MAALLLWMGVAMKASEKERRAAATSRRKDRVCFAMLLLLLDAQGRKRGFDQDRAGSESRQGRVWRACACVVVGW